MYLRFDSNLEFPELAKRLHPDLAEDSLDWDSENVYEWMYLDLPHLSFSLNVSREHGYADVADEVLDKYQGDNAKLREIVGPGPVYVIGWNRNTDAYVNDLSEELIALIADRAAVDVAVFSGRINVDAADGTPLRVVEPSANGR